MFGTILRRRLKVTTCMCLLVLMLLLVVMEKTFFCLKLFELSLTPNVDLVGRNRNNMEITTKPTTTVPENRPKFILINTYMRSGSTILGSLLGHHDDAFYFYEPLQGTHIYKYINGTKLCDYYKPICREGMDSKIKNLLYIGDIFNCSLRSHIRKYNPSIHFSGGHLGPKWKTYGSCKSRKYSTVDQCLGVMETVCSNTSHRVIKSLRVSLKDAAHLLEVYPNMYIFHILRDPRAIITSHIYTKWYPVNNNNARAIRDDAITQCNRLRDDIRSGRELMARYPHRVRLLQYEDFARDVSKIKTLYRMIGADRISGIDEFITNVTKKKFDGSKVPNVTSTFPREFRYRELLSFETMRNIQTPCENVIQLLGLQVFRTEDELRNPDIKSIPSQLSFEIQN